MFIIRSECCESIPCWLEAAIALVADICLSGLATFHKPSEASADVLDQVPDIEGVDERFNAKGTAVVGVVGVGIQARYRF